MMSKEYEFEIKTNTHAGSIERDMCAYITGHLRDCGVGQEYADMFNRECSEDLVPILRYEYDDHSGFGPVCGGGDDYQSVLIHLEDEPTKDEINLMKSRAGKFASLDHQGYKKHHKQIKILGFNLITRTTKTEISEI